MSNLANFNKDGLELVIDQQTGEVFASQSGLGRIVNRNESTIRDFVASRQLLVKDAEIHTTGGLQGARLINN